MAELSTSLKREYGIIDPKDNRWIGDEHGPLTWPGYDLAQIAAQVISVRLYGTQTKLRAKEYIRGPKRKVEDLPKPKMEGEEALRLIEEGRVL